MYNPFESGHIKNYILLYVSVVVIMVLFFIATTLLRDEKKIDTKVFKSKSTGHIVSDKKEDTKGVNEFLKDKFKLLDKSY